MKKRLARFAVKYGLAAVTAIATERSERGKLRIRLSELSAQLTICSASPAKSAATSRCRKKEIGTLNVLTELIANYKMHQAMLSFAGGIRAKLSRGAKGAIKVERSETKKDSAEVKE